MQSDRRQELAENDLAGTTIDLVDRVRPHLGSILVAVGVLFAALAAWTLITSQQAAGQARSWADCFAALSRGNGEGLTAVIRQHPETPAAAWAELVLADSALQDGCDRLFTDRVQATVRLEDASGRYRQVLAARPTGMLAERAVFGLARANEALGNLDEARKGYEAVVADHAGGAAASLAAGRVAELSREATRQWYDWFASQKPKPAPAASGTAPAASPETPAADGSSTPPAESAPATDK